MWNNKSLKTENGVFRYVNATSNMFNRVIINAH